MAAHVPHSEADVLVLHGLHVKPIVGIVVTVSPSFSVYRMVVFPAASRPTMRMHVSFLPKGPLKRFAKIFPMLQTGGSNTGQRNLQEQGVLGFFLCCPGPGKQEQLGDHSPTARLTQLLLSHKAQADESLVPFQKKTVLPTYLLSL